MIGNKLIVKIVIAGVVLGALFFGYRLLFPKPAAAPTAAPGLVAAGYLSGDAGQHEVTDEFLRILNSLQGVELKGDLFASDFFRSLNDIPIILPEETPGRPNPFAPLGVNVAPNASSTTPAPPVKKKVASPPAPSQADRDREELFRSLGQ